MNEVSQANDRDDVSLADFKEYIRRCFACIVRFYICSDE